MRPANPWAVDNFHQLADGLSDIRCAAAAVCGYKNEREREHIVYIICSSCTLTAHSGEEHATIQC